MCEFHDRSNRFFDRKVWAIQPRRKRREKTNLNCHQVSKSIDYFLCGVRKNASFNLYKRNLNYFQFLDENLKNFYSMLSPDQWIVGSKNDRATSYYMKMPNTSAACVKVHGIIYYFLIYIFLIYIFLNFFIFFFNLF